MQPSNFENLSLLQGFQRDAMFAHQEVACRVLSAVCVHLLPDEIVEAVSVWTRATMHLWTHKVSDTGWCWFHAEGA